MAAERRALDAPMEEMIYWDTSFVVAALFPDEDHHGQCRSFRQRFDTEQSLPIISDFVLDELAFWVVKAELIAEARQVGKRWVDVKKEHPDLVRAAYAAFAPRRTEVETHTVRLSLPDTVTDRAFQLMQDFALLPTDAYHIATATESGVKAFATLDEDFLAVDDIIVYTCLP